MDDRRLRQVATAAAHRPDIDGLRAVAVVVVVAYHAFPLLLPGGFVGVDVFFVISGYLISGIILGATRRGPLQLRAFYARRMRRIFPALVAGAGGVLAIGRLFVLFADDYRALGRHVAAGAAFVSNFLLWRESSYFDAAAELKPLLHLWSLGIEEQFYLVWPLMLVFASRWRRGPLALTLLLGAASFVTAIWTVRIDRTAAFYAPWTRSGSCWRGPRWPARKATRFSVEPSARGRHVLVAEFAHRRAASRCSRPARS